MSVLHRIRRTPTNAEPDPTPAAPPQAVDPSPTAPTTPAARTRTSAAWFGICAAAATLVILIVFMLQNTRTVEVTFLWMHGTLPLALALLIAGVGVAILAMIIAVARITQLRRRVTRQQH